LLKNSNQRGDMKVGVVQKLKVAKVVDFGLYLVDEDGEEVLLPKRYEPSQVMIGDMLEVFLYTDSDDRVIATTQKPLATLGEIVALTVVDVAKNGCYLDIGLQKDIFMPTKNPDGFKKGDTVVVKISKDRQDRLTARLGVKETLLPSKNYKANDEVEILLFEKSELGYGCVVDRKYYGMLYANEVFEKLSRGEKRKAFVKKVRPDGKIDLCLKQVGVLGVNIEKERLINALEKNGGVLYLHYDSPPEEITKLCSLSKKGFKRALSESLREGIVKLNEGEKIELVKK